MRTVILLLASNIFMTFAWYYHLQQKGWPLWKAIALSWLIAFFEYCLMPPANRYGFANGFTGYQLKMIREVITLVVFCLFAMFVLKEPPQFSYLISFALLPGCLVYV